MALEFKTSEQLNEELGRTGSIENLGTLESLMPKGTKIKFGKNNFANDKKRVVVVATDKAGKIAIVSCSEPVSNVARKLVAAGKTKPEVLGWLITLDVVENENGMFISKPLGEAGESIEIGKLKKVTSEEFIPADLVAW